MTKHLLIPIIILTFVSCGLDPESSTITSIKCDDVQCVCTSKGYCDNGTRFVNVFRCDKNNFKVGDTVIHNVKK